MRLAPLAIGSANYVVGQNRKAVFLDRDGVIIQDRANYVCRFADVTWIPGAAKGAALLQKAGFELVIVTNQAGVAKGLLSESEARTVHHYVVNHLASRGAFVGRSYLCPHAHGDGCPCRKPRAGMLLRAAEDLNIDLRKSFLVGDAWTDIAAARSVEVVPVLVRTGRGAQQIADADPTRVASVVIANSLFEAAKLIAGGLV